MRNVSLSAPRLLFAAALLATSVVVGGARAQDRDVLPAALSADARVSMITVLPGDPVYTMFGHTALRVIDPQTDFDASFNYGTFDFDRTFPFRFASGRLDYRLSVAPTLATFAQYEFEGRTIIEQHLALDSTDVAMLYAMLRENYRPENRYYRYDFFFDNCSTRIRDILEAATGVVIGTNRMSGMNDAGDDAPTLRDLLKPYTERTPFLGALMHTGLGMGADRPAAEREKAFLPIELLLQVDAARTDLASFVVATDTLYDAGLLPESRKSRAVWIVWLVVLAAIATSGIRIARGKSRTRFFDALLFGVVGVAGLLLVYLWFGSEHTVTERNLNVMWAWPTHAVAAVFLAKRHLPTWMRGYLAIAGASAVVFLCGLLWWTQDVPALVVPIVLLLAFRAGRCLLSASTGRPANV